MDLAHYYSYLEVDLEILKQNALNIKAALEPERVFIPVVKGNAHGFGTVPVARLLIEEVGVKTIACAQICEAIDIRNAGYKDLDILLLGGVPFHGIPYAVKYDLQMPIYDVESARLLSNAVKEQGKSRQKIQIKIDTGLHRIGVQPGEKLDQLLDHIIKLGNLEIDGVYSHFSNAYEINDPFARSQYELYAQSLRQVRNRGIRPKYIHICCSGAAAWLEDRISTHARLGCMFIGFSPMSDGSNPFNVRQAAAWRAFITNICELEPGEAAGYGRGNIVSRPTKTATLSIGYCDGFFRPLAMNKGPLLVNGKIAHYLSVAMDQIFIDVTDIDCEIGDEVTIFGKDKSSGLFLSTMELAAYADHNPASLHGYINGRVKRIYINGNT